MDYGWVVFAGTFLIALVWNLRTGGIRAKAVRDGAQKVRGQLVALYGGAHDVREVRLARYPALDLGFYDDGSRRLAALGYRFLHDIEDLTVSEATGMPTCIRAHAGDHSATRAGLMHLRVRGWQRIVAPLFGMPRDLFAVEFITEFADGRFLITNNTKGVGEMPMPENWVFEKFAPDTAFERIEARHRERVRALGLVPVKVHSVHDAFASYARQWMAASDWWHGRGAGMSRDEWAKVTGTDSKLSNDLYDEVNR
ncbi:MAG: hypothetical protein ACYTEG_09105 [Planctomycetota bacterium]